MEELFGRPLDIGDMVLRYYPSAKDYRVGLIIGKNLIFCSGISDKELYFEKYSERDEYTTLIRYCYCIKGSSVPVIKLDKEETVYNMYYQKLCNAYKKVCDYNMLKELHS